ncbi:MAG: cytochrome c nitrite reductase small subunit [Pyrinomonadaceae bacterium]|jgi:cytochrome c nitrite reductase small subunit|nr:cytochrome c nitrite reductase small subunit [Pyrinomonadaceae bacterium]
MNRQTLKLIIVGIAIGLTVGGGFYTFYYAKGYSYLSNNPASCANCHIMNEQFDGWIKSSHKDFATCNDCHTPHEFFGKYITKAENGFWHSYYFTTETFHEPIQITEKSRKITEASCRHCHSEAVSGITLSENHKPNDEVSCISCHRSVGHLH